MLESPEPKSVNCIGVEELDGMNIWGIDGSNQTLDFSAFQTLSRLQQLSLDFQRPKPSITQFQGLIVRQYV